MTSTISINGQRLWQSLMDLAQIGATPKGGVCRLALTALDGVDDLPALMPGMIPGLGALTH